MPNRIGKYNIVSRLGEGATSEVFLAVDAFNHRNVAIKRVRLSTAGESVENHYRDRFFAAEAALVGKLQQGVCAVKAAATFARLYFMPVIEQDLLKILRERKIDIDEAHKTLFHEWFNHPSVHQVFPENERKLISQ